MSKPQEDGGLFSRDENGVLHIVAISGGHDSTLMAFLLKEREPRPYNYVCTPTGNELPEMFDFWRWLGSDNALGRRLVPIMNGTLESVIADQKMIPNSKARFCTRILKIEPFRQFLKEQAALGPVVSYVGLRADEPGRAGGAYDDIQGVAMRFPLREWGMDESAVQAGLAERGIVVPERTDCAWCYHQTIGEWWRLWHDHKDIWAVGEQIEERSGGHTFRSDSRDTWPASMKGLRERFQAGHVPTRRGDPRQYDLMREIGQCRVCRL